MRHKYGEKSLGRHEFELHCRTVSAMTYTIVLRCRRRVNCKHVMDGQEIAQGLSAKEKDEGKEPNKLVNKEKGGKTAKPALLRAS